MVHPRESSQDSILVLTSTAHILKLNDTEKINMPLRKDDMQVREAFHIFKRKKNHF